MSSRRRAFTLAEVLLALGMAAVVILSLGQLGIALLASNRKSVDISAAQLVAEGELQRALYQAQGDSGNELWTASGAFRHYNVKVGVTDYQVTLYGDALNDTAGNPLEGRRVEVLVSWWDQADRVGYGRLQTRNSRVVAKP